MDREVFLKQIDDQLQHCAAGANQERDCLIFWFYYLQGMSAKAIAALATIRLTAKGVEAVIFRLTRCVREQLGQLGNARLGGAIAFAKKRIPPANVVLEGVADFDTAIRQTSRQRRTG